ncbi:hypothetical protein ZZ1p0132 [Acinetobacter phage ZZ1]|jgi:hypothetical protein|uniref:Uncharacterized protein n=2 Tax=Caudoviricetes TaxID=2731619 RepID=I3WVC8_9CAUD|nr:hypothetical protein ZZ1p0132 [Acinetobacter phage ZZ1]AFL47448.1 hypothetical protein ZZ1p0132 [Acinetobacter phage ZZ1]
MSKFKENQTVFVWRKCRFGKIKSIRYNGSVQTLWIDLGKHQGEAPCTRLKTDLYFQLPRTYPNYAPPKYTAITKLSSMINWLGLVAALLIIVGLGTM